MIRWLLALTPLLLAAQCDTPPPRDPEPAPPAPAPPWPPRSADCGSACARLAELGCDAANPTDAGASCLEVCRNVEASGTLRMPVECVTTATSCADAESCR